MNANVRSHLIRWLTVQLFEHFFGEPPCQPVMGAVPPPLLSVVETQPERPSVQTFASLGVPKTLVSVLTAQGIESPFPIQAKTLPDSLGGRDVLGRGRTGSGKTLAFGLPLVARLAEAEAAYRRKPGRPLGLVLAPTRELATQINATIEPLAQALGLNTTVIYGGCPSNARNVLCGLASIS